MINEHNDVDLVILIIACLLADSQKINMGES